MPKLITASPAVEDALLKAGFSASDINKEIALKNGSEAISFGRCVEEIAEKTGFKAPAIAKMLTEDKPGITDDFIKAGRPLFAYRNLEKADLSEFREKMDYYRTHYNDNIKREAAVFKETYKRLLEEVSIIPSGKRSNTVVDFLSNERAAKQIEEFAKFPEYYNDIFDEKFGIPVELAELYVKQTTISPAKIVDKIDDSIKKIRKGKVLESEAELAKRIAGYEEDYAIKHAINKKLSSVPEFCDGDASKWSDIKTRVFNDAGNMARILRGAQLNKDLDNVMNALESDRSCSKQWIEACDVALKSYHEESSTRNGYSTTLRSTDELYRYMNEANGILHAYVNEASEEELDKEYEGIEMDEF